MKFPRTIQELASTYPDLVVEPSLFIKDEIVFKTDYDTFWRASESETGNPVFIKEINLPQLSKMHEISYCREISILQQLNHRFITQLIGFTISAPFYVITEFCSSGNIRSLLYNAKNKISFSGTHLSTIALSLSHALWFMHKRDLIHGNLTLDNVMLDGNKNVKICRFEYSVSSDSPILRTIPFPSMAPEMVDSTEYTSKVDVYAFGYILYEFCEGIYPFRDIPQEDLLFMIKNNSIHPPFSNATSESLKKLIHSKPSI